VKPYYNHGEITIYHGDCREILPTLAPVDLVLTDPPYSSLDVSKGGGSNPRLVRRDALSGKRLASSTTRSWFSTLSADQLGGIWPLLRKLLPDDGALYVMADVKSGLEFFPALAPANVIVWDKGAIGMGYSWRRMHEWIAYCPCEDHVLRDKGLGDIIRVSGESCKEHPTEKPKRLFHPIIRNSSDPSDTVLDPFMGSGTVLAAAKDLGRRAIGIEIEERYCEIAAQRLSQEVLGL
jgi:site-specific DNA-methyltransferase (adenine-specific)